MGEMIDERAVEVGAEQLDFHAGFRRAGAGTLEIARALSTGKPSALPTMKSAYELAMERLEKQAPTATLTDAQKSAIAEIDSEFRARIAEREVFLGGELAKARATGDGEAMASLEKQLSTDVRRLNEDCEAKKEKVRAS